MKKLVYGDKVELTSDYVEGDIVKFECKDHPTQLAKIEYSKIIKVKARLSDDRILMLSYVMENNRHVELNQIKEMVKRNPNG